MRPSLFKRSIRVALTSQQSVQHYENFPVGSILLPRQFRPAVAAVYHFARHADDIADEGDLPPHARFELLAECSAELERITRNEKPLTPRYQALAPVIRNHAIPLQLFEDLLSAFRQDVVKTRYCDHADVLDYCRRSADPVGRILLHIFDEASPENLICSDQICSALQLVNFWQDVAIDWQKNRIYLPQDDMLRFGVSENHLAHAQCDQAFRELLRFECQRTRAMMEAGSPLGRRLPGRVGLEIRTIVAAATRVLDKLEEANYDIFNARPKLTALDWPGILWRAL
jgi:squalene synthase HpnC